MSKSFLLLCLLAASGCTVSTGIKTQGDPRYDLNLSRNLSPNRVSHYERKYDIFRGKFVTEAVHTREYQIKTKIRYYDQCIAGEMPYNPYSSMTMIRGKPWLYEALPDHQIEWLIEQYHKRAKRTKILRSEYISFANKLSELLKERNQNNES
tara:strand:+ start:1527 stop:1982 length:456 start_codon:yes stop_codon:yes gene_type:complete